MPGKRRTPKTQGLTTADRKRYRRADGTAVQQVAENRTGMSDRTSEPDSVRALREGLTLRQQRFAEAVVTAPTLRAAGISAGYGGASQNETDERKREAAGVMASLTIRNPRVQALAEAIGSTRRDKAKGIFDRAGANVHGELFSNTDPMFSLAAWKTSVDVMERLPDEETGTVVSLDRLRAVRQLYRAMLAGAQHPGLLPRFLAGLRSIEEALQVVVAPENRRNNLRLKAPKHTQGKSIDGFDPE